MQSKTSNIVIAIALAVSAGGVFAQQQQQYGRDSLSVSPGHSASAVSTGTNLTRFGRDSVYANQPQTGSAAPLASNATTATRFGRDSVYATQSPGPSTSVATNVPGLQPFGRDSVYAIQLQNPARQSSETRIGRVSPKSPGG
jgi:hypothetical protein